jgi:DNA-binding NarL/FixJ family response regulator
MNKNKETGGKSPELLIEVAKYICNGFTASEAAHALAISKRAVEKHRNEIYRPLNVRNAEGLIRAALRIGIVTREELVFHIKTTQ